MIDQSYEGEVEVVVITNEAGEESYYMEEDTFTLEGKRFAVLVSLPGEEDDEENFDSEYLIARLEKNDEGIDCYVDPTEEEFEVAFAYLTAEEEDET